MSAAAHVQVNETEIDEEFAEQMVRFGMKYMLQLARLPSVEAQEQVGKLASMSSVNSYAEERESIEYYDYPDAGSGFASSSSPQLFSWESPAFPVEAPELFNEMAAQRDGPKSAVEILQEGFDVQNPPQTDDLEEVQRWLECEAQQESVAKYQNVIDAARNRRDYASLPLIQRQIVKWFPLLQSKFAEIQQQFLNNNREDLPSAGHSFMPYMCALSPEKLAVITAHTALLKTLSNPGGVPFVTLMKDIGEDIEEEVLLSRALFEDHMRKVAMKNENKANETQDTSGLSQETAPSAATTDQNETEEETKVSVTAGWTYAASHLNAYLDDLSRNEVAPKKRVVLKRALRKVRKVLEGEEEWPINERFRMSAFLFKIMMEIAEIRVDNKDEKAFFHEVVGMKKRVSGKMRYHRQGYVGINESFQRMIHNDDIKSFAAHTTRQKPMVVPPKPWTGPGNGCYLWLKSQLMRHHGSKRQEEALSVADNSVLLDGLNVLGTVPWKINKRLLEVAQECWDKKITIGDIPSQTDLDVPPKPDWPEELYKSGRPEPGTAKFDEWRAKWVEYNEQLRIHKKKHQQNMDLRSLRCSAILKLDQAEKFKDFDKIYFPYNIDFRGRAYPIPPHLSNVGSDMCRGLLQFSEAKPLGRRGLYWLKVHLANFAGNDKISYDDRAAFVDENIDVVRRSAENPFEERWWMELDDPFQGLSTCQEIVNAIDSGKPEEYACSLPVHMDGSCNGLQHYAALGRDKGGGSYVNMCPSDKPQDVYSGVMKDVIKLVDEEANRTLDFDYSDESKLSPDQRKELKQNLAAKLLNGHIDRGVVKRPVMTSVYGVTHVGARAQIEEKVVEKLEIAGHDVDSMEREIFHASGYLAKITKEVIKLHFTGAEETMTWLTTCAKLIAQRGYPVAWVSPIGVPVVQPYRRAKPAEVVTALQIVRLRDSTSDDLPLHKSKQVTAFPPNFVHSLDSAHMHLTALEMDRRGLTFSAVHDSFWTHPCDVDEMNTVLRDVFVDLYEKPILEDLKQGWELRYPGIEFPNPPETGDLDIQDVKKALYFFQ
eukprot:CAMPEP_0172440348 /NCGR_PEP_ID=MMETSP1065-20121228/993_1 /TAXON_ID=265537 /ORGANISM="Amphiprora paludosa, Strain CCMP125" /LENGTH=1049 /DNA_ID=CAMNT_0013189139 /DNA_START=238 /DNA_END=3387 /DNA_ORIENTATION=-